MHDALRSSDRVARWGGKELLIPLDVIDHSESLQQVIVAADANLLKAREPGRSCVVVSW